MDNRKVLGRMKRIWRAYSCQVSAAHSRKRLRDWYHSEVGQALGDQEQYQLDEVLSNLFGYHLVQLGHPLERDLLEASRIHHRVVVESESENVPAVSCLSDFCALPFASDSLDVVVLPHTLEFEHDPHQLLREVERTLIPEGHVVILGFNPWSLWGWLRVLVGWRHHVPWCGHFFSTLRIRDWLALLGFDTVLVRGYFYRPPIQHKGVLQRLLPLERWGGHWWPFAGAGYILVAKKRVTTLTPIKPRWRSQRILGGRLAEPTTHRERYDRAVRNDR